MLKNILFLIGCILITIAAWLVFQAFGQHTFSIMLIISAVVIFKIGWTKLKHRK